MELETFLRVLIQKWRIVLLLFAITFIAAVIFTRNQPRIYEARATYVAKLSSTIQDNREFANIISILSSRVEISTTFAQVANSRRLRNLAAERLDLSPEALGNLSVNSRLIPGTNIIEIVVQGTDPILVRDFANAIGASTSEYAKNLYGAFTLAPLDEAGTSRRPIQPNTALNLMLGGVLGLVLGSAIALLAYFFETFERNPKDSPDNQASSEAASAHDSSILLLRQDMMAMREQFENTKRELDQIHAALKKTNSYAKDIRSAVKDLEEHFEGNHVDVGKVKLGKDEN